MQRPKARKILSSVIVFFVIAQWVFTGWPQFLHNLSFPPKVQIAEAVVDTYTSSTTWTAPPGVTTVTAEVWGGGGGGGGQNLASDGGGGGGGGAYSKKTNITVVPNTGYTVTVGAAGTGNSGCTASTAGGDSWFNSTGTVLAKGGSPGACSTGTPPSGGAGGAAASGVGDVGSLFSGGQGEKGRNSTTGRGGYGGSSAGTAADGWSGPQTWSTATYPTANTPSGGGGGGDGGGSNLAAGSVPASGNGGGGGGAAEGSPSNIKGGDGAVGKVILTYNKPPNAPSQDSPTSGQTGVSITPTFTMTTTDADSDNLGYKVTIYSNSGCTTIAQDNDQATSTSGWTGTNGSCTANPTSCYTSGTQGSFLAQTSLSGGTQYWWRAKAKDPDGNGGTTDSSTCNSFTTVAGSLALTASSSQSFASAITLLFTSQTSTMTNVGAIKVADDRGGSPGWTLAMTGADWKSGQDVMQLDYDGTGSNDNLGKMCIKPNNGTLYAESGSLTGVSKGTLACFSASVTSITVLTATNGNGTGIYWLTDMPAEQFFPSSPTVASYTTTIVLTLS